VPRVIGTCVVVGACVVVVPSWLATTLPFGTLCLAGWADVVVTPTTVGTVVGRTAVVTVVGARGSRAGGGGTLVPSETASAPSALLMDASCLLAAIRCDATSPTKVSAKLANWARCNPTLSGRTEARRGRSSASSRRPACTVTSP
jgi:hypothetical protein